MFLYLLVAEKEIKKPTERSELPLVRPKKLELSNLRKANYLARFFTFLRMQVMHTTPDVDAEIYVYVVRDIDVVAKCMYRYSSHDLMYCVCAEFPP